VLLKNGVKIRKTQMKNVIPIRNKELAQENAASQWVLNEKERVQIKVV